MVGLAKPTIILPIPMGGSYKLVITVRWPEMPRGQRESIDALLVLSACFSLLVLMLLGRK